MATSGSAMIRRLAASPSSILFRAIAAKANGKSASICSTMKSQILISDILFGLVDGQLGLVASFLSVSFAGLASYPVVRHQSTDGVKVETRRKCLHAMQIHGLDTFYSS